MYFALTSAALQWIENNPGGMPVLDEFRIGSAHGYTPETGDTDLHGSVLFVGVPSSKGIQSTGDWLYEGIMDTSVGSFYWGEIGLYRQGVLFALGAQSVLNWKAASVGAANGNRVSIQVALNPTYPDGLALIGNSSNDLNVHYALGVSQLPPAQTAFPNIVLIPSPLNPQVSVIATSSNGSWSVSGWDATRFQGEIAAASANYVVIDDDLAPPTLAGEYLITFLSGKASGLIRPVSQYDEVTRRLSFEVALPFTPEAGDVVRVIQSKAATSADTLPKLLWQLDPSLTADDLNQLVDLDSFFGPLLPRDGSRAMTSALDLGANKVFNLADPSLAQDAVTKSYADGLVVGLATESYVGTAVAGLATESFVTSSIAGLASQSYVAAEIETATSGLASQAYVDASIVGFATEAFVTSAVDAGTAGLATENYVTQAVSAGVIGLASTSYVDAQVLGLASETFVDAEITKAIEGLASTSYVDSSISTATSGLASIQYVDDAISSIPPPDGFVKVDGTSAMEANLPMAGFLITGLGTPANSGDAANKGYVDAAIEDIVPPAPPDLTPYLLLDGTRPMVGDLNMGSNRLIGLSAPLVDTDAATKAYVDAGLASLGIVVRRAVLSNDITGLSGSPPTAITWDTGDFDPLEPTRIYVPPGFSHALITGTAMVTGTGEAEIRIWHNGDTADSLGYNRVGSVSPTRISMCAQMWPVSSGDYFEMAVSRTTSLTGILSANSYSSFSLTLFP